MGDNSPAIHYGWHIVWAGTLCIFASIGLGRFAIGMLLPAMAKSLSLTYSQMGMISTMNFVGYLVAVVFCGFLADKIGYRYLIFFSLLVVALSMALISRAADFRFVMFLYTITGLGSGASNVPMMALVSSWFASKKRGKSTGYVVIGSGFAILLVGKLVPFVNRIYFSEGWRVSWLILGCLVFVVAIVCLVVLRDSPYSQGLHPCGAESACNVRGEDKERSVTFWGVAHLGALYFLFGSTYVIYATFIVTCLIQDHGFSEAAAGNFWASVGFLSLFSGPVFGTLSDKIGRKVCLMIVFFIQAIAYLLMATPLPDFFLYISIGCYGVVAWSIPSVMSALVGDYAGPRKAAKVFGLITFIFGLGQIAGPAGAGWLAEKMSSFGVSFLLAGILALMAVVLAGMLPSRVSAK